MIEGIIRWSVDNRNLILLLAVILIAGGLYSARQTPLDAIPDLSDVQVIVKTSFPGQAPQVVEDQITYPLTTAMLAVPGAVTVRGYSFFGDSYVYVLFEEGTDLYWARSRVLEYLSQVAALLPEGAAPALGPDATGVGWVYQYALIDRTGGRDLSQLRTIQDWFLKYELQSLPGVSEVATIGGHVRQYQVVVDPNRLRAYGLPLQRVRMAIQAGNQETGGSVVELAEAEYMVRATGYITGVEDLRSIPIAVTKTGTPILLDDIADIVVGPQLRRGVGELNGEGEAVGGVIIIRWGENALATIEGVKTRLAELKDSLPVGVEIVETYDRSALIQRSIDNLFETLAIEFFIVAIVCALFLYHFRSSLVVVISLPIGVLAAFVVMNAQGINANIMSLGGIAIAIGTMVDAAIVMVENFHKNAEREGLTPENRWHVVTKSATEVGPPLFFSLLIITLSFLPIFTLQAQEGRLFKPLAYTATYAMAAAAILGITLVPALLGYLVRGRLKPESENPANRFLMRYYRPLLSRVLDMPKTVVAIAFVLMISAVYPALRIGSEFMPDLDEGDLLYMPSAFPAVSAGKIAEVLQQTNKLIRTIPEVEQVHGKAGRADTATDPAPLTMIETVIKLKPREEWRSGMTMEKLRAELDRTVQVPSLTNVWTMPIKNRLDMLATGIKTPVGIKVAGPDLNVIADIATQIEQVIEGVPGTLSVYAERVTGGRFIDIEIDRAGAARYGLNIRDVQDIVRTAIGGMNITESVEGLERFPVNLRYPRDVRDSMDRLRTLPIVAPNGAQLALGQVAEIHIEEGPGLIRSEDARLNGWIYVDIADRDLGSYVDEAQKAVSDQVSLPPGYSIGWSGQFEFMERAQERLQLILPMTLVIIVLLLYLSFRSFVEVALILLLLPLSLVGAIWLLYLLNFNISVAAGVGFIALAGVATELGVLMLAYLNQSMKQRAETKGSLTIDDVKEAVIEGAVRRVRPIFMTTSTVVLALFPIMLSTGTGSDVMRRIAAPMVGGMTGALLLALFVIPAAYFIVRTISSQRQPKTQSLNAQLRQGGA